MRFKTLFPWLLLAAVLAYVYVKLPAETGPEHHPAPSFSEERQSTPGTSQALVNTGPASYAAAVQVAAPAVVNIYTTQKVRMRNPLMDDPYFRRFFDNQDVPERRSSSLGSGVIVSPEGYVLTNNHVVARADEIIVALKDGRETRAKIIGTDPGSDLAVIRIDLPKLPVLPMRSSPLQVGDVVLAIGNPFGVGQTVTQGIVSALGRQGLGINAYEDFIQTDAAINPGNSGGALVDVNGNLVGINSAIYSQSGGSMGIGFAIPVSLSKSVMEAIIQNGKVVRGWLGVEVQTMEPGANPAGSSSRNGALIAGILRGGPAQAGGMQPGDILTELDGQKIVSASQAINLIASLKPGREVVAVVLRGDSAKRHEVELRITIGERPADSATPDGQP